MFMRSIIIIIIITISAESQGYMNVRKLSRLSCLEFLGFYV